MSGDAVQSLEELSGAVSLARVVRADDPRAPVVRSSRFGPLAARLAVVGEYVPQVGDTVLVAHDEHQNRYVVGVVRALRPVTPAGVCIEHQPEASLTVLRVPEGDLRLEATSGRVEIHAALGVEVRSERDLALEARGDVDLRSCSSDGVERSGVHLHGDSAELRAGLLSARAAHLYAVAERATVIAARADVHLERLRQRAEVVELEAGTIVERAKESYRTVEGLAQTHAGRLKLVAETTLHTLAERTKMRAKRLFAIDGDSIHLG